MIANAIVLVCAAFGIVAGSSCEFAIPQQSQYISVPVSAPVSTSSISIPSFSAPVSTSSISLPVITSESSTDSLSALLASSSSSSSSSAVQATNGPEVSTEALPVIEGPAVTLPAVEGPLITLSSEPIPPIRVLASKCICTKTVVRPQPYQRTVVVPKVQRYLKRTVTPVVENVSYKSKPIEQASSVAVSAPATSSVVVSSGSSDYQTGYVSAPVVSAPVISTPVVSYSSEVSTPFSKLC